MPMKSPAKLVRHDKGAACEMGAVDIGLEGFGECPIVGPNTCARAVPFGYGFLCTLTLAVTDEGEVGGRAYSNGSAGRP